MIQQLMDDIQAYLGAKPSRTEEEQCLLNRLQEGYFPITSVNRDDLASKGFDVRKISDGDMRELASKMADDYCEQLFWSSMEIIAEDCLGLPKFPECPSCNENHITFDLQNEVCHCECCGQEWSENYILVEDPEETDQLPDELGYPSLEARNSNARYIPEYDYISIFRKAPEPNSYYKPVSWPESQKYMQDENSEGNSIDALNELINDEYGIAEFGSNAVWVPLCNLNTEKTSNQ